MDFQVLDNVERLPGVYMHKNGELVPYDGSEVNSVVILERWTLRELKKKRPEIHSKLHQSPTTKE